MKTRRVVALFAVFLGLLLMASQSFASQARIVRLSFLDGPVDIERPGVDSERAVLNMPVIEGTRLVVGKDGAVEVEFENSSTLRAVGPAIITFRQMSLDSSGNKTTYVDLQPGTYYFNVNHKGDDDFQVATLNRNVRVKKSARFRIIATDENSRLAVYKGEVKLEGEEREVTVKKNETMTLDVNDAGRYFLAKGIEPGPEDSWDTDREQYRDRYAQSESWKYANNSYGSPYSYGFTDLNYYGNYFNVPGWGWMWRPASFGPGWDPYDNGAWSYYPGQGWMFVSMYPWGWAPYRYGQWVYVPAYGWCWRPGTHYNNWHTVPVFRNAPPTWHRQAPPPQSAWRRTVVLNPGTDGGPGTWHQPGQVNQVPPRQSVVAPQGQQRVIGPSGRTVGRENPNTGMRGGDPEGKAIPAPKPSLPDKAAGSSGTGGYPPPHVMDNRGGASETRDTGGGAGTWHRSTPEQPGDKSAPRTMTTTPSPTPAPRTAPPAAAPSTPAPRTTPSTPEPKVAPSRGGSDFAPRMSAPSPQVEQSAPSSGAGTWHAPSGTRSKNK
jgi:hypothetical protein